MSEQGDTKDSCNIMEEKSEEYKNLIDYGLDTTVASRLDEIFKTGKLSHKDLDKRARDALKEFPTDGALAVLAQFVESNLEHVNNKSAYLCGMLKTYRQRSRAGSGSLVGQTISGASGSSSGSVNGQSHKGPDEEKIKEILERTGYDLDVTTGQRKYGGPPPGWEGDPPSSGCEVFCGKIPRDMYESDLIPLFEKCGKIWDLRLMMDPLTGLNRGYAFVTFTTRDEALEAVRQLDSYDIGEGKNLKVNVSEPKTRLFVGNIPKSKGKADIEEEFTKLSADLKEVIIYSAPDDKKKNRGFCFLEYDTHKAASLAKRRLETGRVKVWNCDIIVDWADPQEEPDEETMSQVKVLYVRNLTGSVSEDKLRESFEAYGRVDRVKKIKDYAFVHFDEREHALNAMKNLNGKDIGGSALEISLAKPPSDKRKKEDMLKKREERMLKTFAQNMAVPSFAFGPSFGPLVPQNCYFRPAGRNGPHVGSGSARSLPRSYEAGPWSYGGAWAGDGNWHPSRGGHMSVPWMPPSAGFGWAGANGAVQGAGSGTGNSPSNVSGVPHGNAGGNRGNKKTHHTR